MYRERKVSRNICIKVLAVSYVIDALIFFLFFRSLECFCNEHLFLFLFLKIGKQIKRYYFGTHTKLQNNTANLFHIQF